MAVQAQQPFGMFLPDFEKRIQRAVIPKDGNLIHATAFSIMPGISEAAHFQPDAADVVGVYDSIKGPFTGPNLVQQPIPNCATLNQLQRDTITRTTKRQREVEARQDALSRLLNFQQQQRHFAFLSVVPQTAATISSGLGLAADDVQRNRVPSKRKASSVLMLEELQCEILKYKEELHDFVNMQAEQMKRFLREESQRHATYLKKFQEGQLQRLMVKEAEVEKANHTTLKLEERVKELCLESQLWQKVARDQEVMVSNLRASLEQVVQLEDAESRHCGEARNHDMIAHNQAETKVQSSCKACETVPVNILLLPCRHLCLCKECDKRIEWCPICRAAKIASVEVYMS